MSESRSRSISILVSDLLQKCPEIQCGKDGLFNKWLRINWDII